ncbi:MAG: PTS glucose transporter subunit IIA [Lacrimispora sp.]
MSELLYSPVRGRAARLEDVKDEMFSEKMLGDGIAVISDQDEVMSPVDGTVTMVYETQHAIGISTKDGADVLIHMGIDTVALKGEPFQTKVKVGDTVKKGDLLTVVDWEAIRQKGLDVIVPIIITNKKVKQRSVEEEIKVGDPLLEIV